MSTAYLVFRPVVDYEESLRPDLIFTNREQAEKAKARLLKWARAVNKEMGDYPYGEFDDAKQAQLERRVEVLKKAGRAPYGWDFSTDLSAFSDSFSDGCVEVIELPKNPKL